MTSGLAMTKKRPRNEPGARPEDGVTRYYSDATQGPVPLMLQRGEKSGNSGRVQRTSKGQEAHPASPGQEAHPASPVLGCGFSGRRCTKGSIRLNRGYMEILVPNTNLWWMMSLNCFVSSWQHPNFVDVVGHGVLGIF